MRRRDFLCTLGTFFAASAVGRMGSVALPKAPAAVKPQIVADSPAYVSMPFSSLPDGSYIRGARYKIVLSGDAAARIKDTPAWNAVASYNSRSPSSPRYSPESDSELQELLREIG